MGSANSNAAGTRFIKEFEKEVLGAFRPKSPALAALVDGMWLAVTDDREDVRVFLRLRDGDKTVVLMFPEVIFYADGMDEDDLVERLENWTGQSEAIVRERLARALLT